MTFADALDLSDDIPLTFDPLAVVDQGFAAEEQGDSLLKLTLLGHVFSISAGSPIPTIVTRQESDPLTIFFQSGLSLYQRLSTYRI